VDILHVRSYPGVRSQRRDALLVDRARAHGDPAWNAELFVEERVVVIEAAVLAELLTVIGQEYDDRVVLGRQTAHLA